MVNSSKIKFVAPKVTTSSLNILLAKEFELLSSILLQQAGIKLNYSKATMVESRLSKRLKILGLDTFCDYIKELSENSGELEHFINALTTNKTDFFRESDHFDFLTQKILPEVNPNKKMTVWSAASSSGEEVYTLAIVLSEFYNSKVGMNYRILGSDIDSKMLQKGMNGVYRKDVVGIIPPHLLQKYFLRGGGDNRGLYKVCDYLKSFVKFRKFNLLHDCFPCDIKFDVIFLRNVLIYFDTEVIQLVIDKLYQHLDHGGYLFIGHSETLNNIKHKFSCIGPAIYKKV